MDQTALLPITPEFLPLVTSGAHRQFPEGLPSPVPSEHLQTVKTNILDFIAVADLLSLTTVTPGGWPITACMHFATVADQGQRPVIFMFSNDHTRKLANIAADPRVSAAIFRPKSPETASATPYLQMQGIVRRITDPAEFALALETNFNKVDYEFTKFLGLQDQPAMRFDVLSAAWQPNASTAPSFIDYSRDIAH